MLPDLVVTIRGHPAIEHADGTENLDHDGSESPPVCFLVPGSSDENFRRLESDGGDVLCKVLVLPAGHTPVAEGKVELVDTLALLLIEVVAAKRTGGYGVVLLLIPILLRDVNFLEVAGLYERPVTDFDKDVVGLDV